MSAHSSVLRRLAHQEAAVVGQYLVAPVDRQTHVVVTIDNRQWRLRVRASAPGWSVYVIDSDYTAVMVRPAVRPEIERAVRSRSSGIIVNATAHGPALVYETATDTLVTVHLVPPGEIFDAIDMAYDGSCYWYIDHRPFDPRTKSLRSGRSPDRFPNRAYQAVYRLAHRNDSSEPVRRALELAGAALLHVQKAGAMIDVRWQLDGTIHDSRVDATTLGVISSGVCLSGQDSDFDLTSLVPVMAERSRLWRSSW